METNKKTMRNLIALLSLVIFLPACNLIDGIFKTGVGVGAFIVIAILLIVFVISRIWKRS
jgi:hypothetical protein